MSKGVQSHLALAEIKKSHVREKGTIDFQLRRRLITDEAIKAEAIKAEASKIEIDAERFDAIRQSFGAKPS